MTQPSAKIILDSISDKGHRLTTMEVCMHRFVLAEMNTHRVFSRNSSSSRAIPAVKIIKRVTDDPAYPVEWLHEKAGMVGGLPFNETGIESCRATWDRARDWALISAENLLSIKLHKSLVNRLLEPFMWHTAIITATEWDNFFYQRCSPQAQPEMKAVADAMQRAYYQSTPKQLPYGEWHMPYTDDLSIETVAAYVKTYQQTASVNDTTDILKRISVARCARVSYLTHDGKKDIETDLGLYDKLETSGHWSPFEHVATQTMSSHDCGNFVGWKQFRKTFRKENITKFVPNLPELAQQAMRIEQDLAPWVGGVK